MNEQQFEIDDRVKEIRGFGRVGTVVEAEKDPSWASGYRYLVDFGGKQGNQMTDGQGFEKVCPECDGTGKVEVQSPVYPGEPHMAYLGDTRPCLCTKKVAEEE